MITRMVRRNTKSETRDEILTEARVLFGEKGFESTTMRDIAAGVGIKASSIYNHFPCKNEIVFTVIHDGVSALIERCRNSLAQAEGEPVRQLYAFVREHTLLQIETIEITPIFDAQLFRASSMSRILTEAQQRKLTELQAEVVHMLRDVLKAGKRRKEMSFSNPTVAAFAILGTIEHVPYWYDPDGPVKPRRLADDLGKMALASVNATLD